MSERGNVHLVILVTANQAKKEEELKRARILRWHNFEPISELRNFICSVCAYHSASTAPFLRLVFTGPPAFHPLRAETSRLARL
jgi:hypothetical protein